jgi:Protein of unknown function (DUF3253)
MIAPFHAMIFADDIKQRILKLAEERGPRKTFSASEVAKQVDPHNWLSLIDQIDLVADVLVKEGKITSTSQRHYMKP